MFNKPQRKYCPMIKKACIGDECMFSMRLLGENPQTGEKVDDEGCSLVWNAMLQIENNKAQTQTGAAIESLRNEQVKSMNMLTEAIQTIASQNVQIMLMLNRRTNLLENDNG